MRKWNGLKLGLFTAMALALVMWIAAPVQADLVGWWEFEETGWAGISGEVVDSSSSGNHGTVFGGATTVADGKFGRAASFDGNNDYINCGDYPSFALQDFTFTAWINLVQDETATADFQLIDKNFQYSWRLDFDGEDKLQLIVWDAAGTPSVRGGKADWDAGTWYHVAVVVSGGSIQHYIDGETDGGAGSFTTPTDVGSATLYIGAALGSDRFFNGMIDDVRVYNTALNKTEIQQIMIPEPGSTLLP